MLQNYLPVLLFIIVGIVVGLAPIAIGYILSPKSGGEEKLAPYECGFKEFSDARLKFDVRFYLVAILFIIFDLEIAFMFPWGVVMREVGTPALIAMFIFLGILTLGFIFEWKKGALEWE